MHAFATILTSLRAAIAAKADRDRALTALLVLVWGRISRMQQRLERLIAHWRAGTIPKPRPSRPGRPGKPTTRPTFPTSHAWLIARVGYMAAGYASQLQHNLFADPEFADFLAAAPQAGRILRPLCHMLGLEIPAIIQRDPKPRAPKPRKPRAPRPPPLQPHRSTSPPHLRLRVPGISRGRVPRPMPPRKNAAS